MRAQPPSDNPYEGVYHTSHPIPLSKTRCPSSSSRYLSSETNHVDSHSVRCSGSDTTRDSCEGILFRTSVYKQSKLKHVSQIDDSGHITWKYNYYALLDSFKHIKMSRSLYSNNDFPVTTCNKKKKYFRIRTSH